MRAWVEHGDRKAPSAEPVAEAIYRAAMDSSSRLRYPVKGRMLLTMHALLPSVMWRAMMGAGLNRRPRSA